MRRSVVVVVAAALAASCTPDSDTNVAGTTTGPTRPVAATTVATGEAEAAQALKPYGGEARIAYWSGDSLNPLLSEWAYGFDEAYTVGALRSDWDNGGVVPYLLEVMPLVANGGLVENPDGTLTVNYRIRPEAVWADGVPISGNDFRFTAELLAGIDPADSLRPDAYDWIIADTMVAGAKTFSYTLNRVTPEWGSLFSYLLPEHDVAGKDFMTDFNDEPWVSGGPFIVYKWDTDRDMITLVRNDNYWGTDPATGQQLPYLDRILLGDFGPTSDAVLAHLDPDLHDAGTRYLNDEWLEVIEEYGENAAGAVEAAIFAAELEMFRNGEVHSFESFYWLEPFAIADTVAELLVVPGVAGGLMKGNQFEHLTFNFGPSRFEANPDSMNEYLGFRQAVAHALDREAIVGSIWGSEISAIDSYLDLISPSLSAGRWAAYDYDPDHSRMLLEELCAELGRDCEAEPPTLHFDAIATIARERLAELLTQYLHEVGIDVEWDTVAGPALARLSGPWDSTAFLWFFSFGGGNLVDINALFAPSAGPFDPPNQFDNPYRWCTDDSAVSGSQCDRFAKILERLRTTIDPDAARQLAAEAEQILADDLAIIPLYLYPTYLLWREDLLAGFGMTYSAPSQFWNCAEWYRADLAE